MPAGRRSGSHAISMSRRNAVEAMTGMLKEGFTSIGKGDSRVFETVKNAFLDAFTLVGLNVYLARSFRRKIEDMKRPARHAPSYQASYGHVRGSASTRGAARPRAAVGPVLIQDLGYLARRHLRRA
jgi:hypothetical protein